MPKYFSVCCVFSFSFPYQYTVLLLLGNHFHNQYPVPGLYWFDAASIGPVQAQYWQLNACLQG